MSVTYSDLLAIGLTESQSRILVQLPYPAPVALLKSRSPGRPARAFDLATIITRLDALGDESLVNKLMALRAKPTPNPLEIQDESADA